MSHRCKVLLVLASTAAICGCAGSFSTGSNSPSVLISPASINFGSLPVGTTSPPQTLTVTNSGNEPLAIDNVTVTGASASSFSLTDHRGTGLAAGASCTLQITLLPSAPIPLSGA